MHFDLVSFKIEWLKTSYPKPKLARWEDGYDRLLTSLCPSYLAKSLQHILFIDLSYCLLKHKRWKHLEIFETIVTQFLHEEYHLEEHLSKKIIQGMVLIFNSDHSLVTTHDKNISSQDFLLYLLTTVLSSSNSTLILKELGLGSPILKKIKDLSEKYTQGLKQDHFYFSQDFDLQWLQAMETLSSKIVNSPWAIDSLRFEFLLDEIDFYWSEFFKIYGYEMLFEIFIAIEFGQINTITKFQDVLQKFLAGQKKEECLKNTESLITLLHKKDFIYKEYKNNQGKYKFKITPLGQDISARFYLTNYAKKNPSLTYFLSLCHPWKKIILENIFPEYAKTFTQVLAKKAPLDPLILEIGVKELKMIMPHEKIIEWLNSYIKNGATLEIKKTAQKIIFDHFIQK